MRVRTCYSRKEYTRKSRAKLGPAAAFVRNEKVKKYQATILGKFALRAGACNTAAKQRGIGGKIEHWQIMAIWAKQNGYDVNLCQCNICGRMAEWSIDHIVELKDNGPHHQDNIQLLCRDCHHKKTGEGKAARSWKVSDLWGSQKPEETTP